MEDNIKPILKREPDFIIIYVGANNANKIISREILNKLLLLKSSIIDKYKTCKVIISQPTRRTDNDKVALANNHLCSLLGLNTDTVKNKNIVSWHLGGKGLHLNPHGNGRLVLNLKATIRKV